MTAELQPYASRETALGDLPIWRALPARGRRLIGPWCFLDRYGPISFTGAKPMDVAPHPHIGLQTVSWLLDGEVVHHDTLGCEAVARPGAVNVMTAGRGIAHSEETPRVNVGRLNGVQLWVALPDSQRQVEPAFQHVAELPRVDIAGGVAEVIVGELAGARSGATAFSDLIGACIRLHPGAAASLPLAQSREHGIFVLDGDVVAEGQPLALNTIHYAAPGRDELALRSPGGARLLLLGGTPFGERVLMWWNFVARTPDEIAAARQAWEERRFGEVSGYDGPPLAAPPLSRLAVPNPAS